MNKNITLNDHIIAHCNNSMEIALPAERRPLWMRSCPEMSDIGFLRFRLLRCMGTDDRGRHFLQTADGIVGEQLPLSTYFNSLAIFFESLSFDSRSEINVGVERYSIYENGGIKNPPAERVVLV